MDIFEMIELAKTSEYGATWYSDKGPIYISKEGKLEPIKLKDLPTCQPERSKREDLNCDCHRCFQDNLLKNHYPWLYEQEMKARDGKILCEKIQDAVL